MVGACLDHVRAVQWGTATSQYTTTDGDLLIDIVIEVKCFRKKSPDSQEPKP